MKTNQKRQNDESVKNEQGQNEQTAQSSKSYMEIRVADIAVSEFNLRKNFDKEELWTINLILRGQWYRSKRNRWQRPFERS